MHRQPTASFPPKCEILCYSSGTTDTHRHLCCIGRRLLLLALHACHLLGCKLTTCAAEYAASRADVSERQSGLSRRLMDANEAQQHSAPQAAEGPFARQSPTCPVSITILLQNCTTAEFLQKPLLQAWRPHSRRG